MDIPTIPHIHDPNETRCPVTTVLNLIGAKWKLMILYQLMQGMKRFNELQKLLPGITQKMLAMRLRELEKDEIVTRKIYAVVPPKVEYSLTEFGESLKQIIEPMKLWGLELNKAQDELEAEKLKKSQKAKKIKQDKAKKILT